MNELNYENYCITCDVYDRINRLGHSFINKVKTLLTETYNPFNFPLKRVGVLDVSPVCYDEIEIRYYDTYGDCSDYYSVSINAKLLIEDFDKCVSEFVNKSIEEEILRQERAKKQKEDRQKEIDMEEYQRIKEKYGL